MSTTYAQKQATAQKKNSTTAASVPDDSLSSENLQRKMDSMKAPFPNKTIQMYNGIFTRNNDFQGNEGTPVTRINPKKMEEILEKTKSSRGDLGRMAKLLLEQGGDILAGIHEGGIGGNGRGADPTQHITIRSGGHAYHIHIKENGVVTKITG